MSIIDLFELIDGGVVGSMIFSETATGLEMTMAVAIPLIFSTVLVLMLQVPANQRAHACSSLVADCA
jgi:hypothetical protein